jgi:uncharacterized protein YcbX
MHVSALAYYPIKSCGPTSVQEAALDDCGMVNDRRFLVTNPDGLFKTQREHRGMALIQPQIEGDHLRVAAPDMEPLSIHAVQDGHRLQAHVFRSTCQAVDQGDAIAEWLSTFLKTPCRLVTMAPDFVRRVNPAFARNPEDQVAFADAYPFLLTTEASLDDLNARMATPLPMNRFRPNIVVAGATPYAEDHWLTLQIGAVSFSNVKPCVRCLMTTLDQRTMEQGEEPLRTLARYRRTGEGVIFGQNLIHLDRGTIRVGDTVTVDG